jgi:hypothetical protein
MLRLQRASLIRTLSIIFSTAYSVASAADNPRLALTIYNNDLALVQETRPLDLAAGRTKLEFKDVSASIRPETVSLTSPGISIIEQNFDFDLLTPEKLMEKAVGQEIRIVRINPGNGQQTTETATVLSVNNGVVLKIADHIEVLRADSVPTRVIFDKVPDGLRARPTLSVTLDTDKAGRRDAVLSYLTTGLAWKADYVALFNEAASKMDLQGWITLTNNSGTSFSNADTQLIAGDINIVRGDQANDWRQQQRRQAMIAAGNDPSAKPPLADYYLYPLKEKTTVADKQTKQVSFLEANGVTARKAYEYRANWFSTQQHPQHADVTVQFRNATNAGLGAQLPAGVVRVYIRDVNGKPKFVGENQIEHTPQGSELSIKTGEAFDITVQPTLVSQEKLTLLRSRYTMQYLIRNARGSAVEVEIRQSGLWRDGKIVTESIKSSRVDAYTLKWSVPVKENGETMLKFAVETGW